MTPEQLEKMQKNGVNLMDAEGVQKLGDKPNTTKDSRHTYKVVNASRSPCQCQYKYAGTRKHRFFQLGDLNTEFQSTFATFLPPLNTMCDVVDSAMRDKFGTMQSGLPNYVIVNEYQSQENSIGWHSDADELFDGMNSQSVIFSFNFHRGGIFAVAPMDNAIRNSIVQQHGSRMMENHLLTRLEIAGKSKEIRTHGHIVFRYVPENSLVVMGGHFQSQMMHASLSHKDICSPSAIPDGSPTDGFCQGDLAKERCHTESTKYTESATQSMNCVQMSRKVFTYRFVVKHQETCQFHHAVRSAPLPAAGIHNDAGELQTNACILHAQKSRRPDMNQEISGRPGLHQEAQQFQKHDGLSPTGPTCQPAADNLEVNVPPACHIASGLGSSLAQKDAPADALSDGVPTDVPSDLEDCTVASTHSDTTVFQNYTDGYVHGVRSCWDAVHAVFESVLKHLEHPNCILGQPGGISQTLKDLWGVMQTCCENTLKLLDDFEANSSVGIENALPNSQGMLTKIVQRSGLFSCQIRIAEQLHAARYVFVDILDRRCYDFSRGKRTSCRSARAIGTIEWLEKEFAAILACKSRQEVCADRQAVVLRRAALEHLWSLSTSRGRTTRCAKHDHWDDDAPMEFMRFLDKDCQGQKEGDFWEITFIETNADYIQRSVRYRLNQTRQIADCIKLMQGMWPEIARLNFSVLNRQPDLHATPGGFGRSERDCPCVLWLRCVTNLSSASGSAKIPRSNRSRSPHGKSTPRHPWQQQPWNQQPWPQQRWSGQNQVPWHHQPWHQPPCPQSRPERPLDHRAGHPPSSRWQ